MTAAGADSLDQILFGGDAVLEQGGATADGLGGVGVAPACSRQAEGFGDAEDHLG